MERFFCVYEHVFPNGKKYIGITSQPPEQRRDYGWGYKEDIQPLMYRAIQKYGWKNIQHNILFDHLSLEQATNKEQELILLFHTCVLDPLCRGYNMTYGGEGAVKYLTEEEKNCAQKQRQQEWVNNHRKEKNNAQKRYYYTHHETILEKQRIKRDRTRVKHIPLTRKEHLARHREEERRRKERMTPEQKEELLQKKRAYYYKNKEKINQRNKERYYANKTKEVKGE